MLALRASNLLELEAIITSETRREPIHGASMPHRSPGRGECRACLEQETACGIEFLHVLMASSSKLEIEL